MVHAPPLAQQSLDKENSSCIGRNRNSSDRVGHGLLGGDIILDNKAAAEALSGPFSQLVPRSIFAFDFLVFSLSVAPAHAVLQSVGLPCCILQNIRTSLSPSFLRVTVCVLRALLQKTTNSSVCMAFLFTRTWAYLFVEGSRGLPTHTRKDE